MELKWFLSNQCLLLFLPLEYDFRPTLSIWRFFPLIARKCSWSRAKNHMQHEGFNSNQFCGHSSLLTNMVSRHSCSKIFFDSVSLGHHGHGEETSWHASEDTVINTYVASSNQWIWFSAILTHLMNSHITASGHIEDDQEMSWSPYDSTEIWVIPWKIDQQGAPDPLRISWNLTSMILIPENMEISIFLA